MEHYCVVAVNTSSNKYRDQVDRLTLLAAVLLSTAILILPTGICANDSTAVLGAGGIELTKNEHIRVLEEILEISPQKIRVKYRFFNESDQDIDTKVAFPLPFYDGVAASNISIGDPNKIFATFKVSANNKPVVTKCDRKALLDGRDITGQLRKLGLSDKEIFFDVADAKRADLWQKLEPFTQKVGNWWDISQTIFWDMTFPAGKETVVDHEYAPATGGGWAAPYYRDSAEYFKDNMARLWNSFTGQNQRENEDCLDEITKRAIENRVKMAVAKGPDSVTVSYRKVEYILGTGRNWKGPIGEFRLKLVKERPDQFVSVCFPGKPEKTSPTVYEFYQKDFIPQDTLIANFYTVE